MIAINPAEPSELDDIFRLLERASLPLAGLAADSLLMAAHDKDKGRIVGSAALEEYPSGVLLRSVAVDQSVQGFGVGKALTRAALALAASRGHRAAYLLTTTAEGFFPKFGFEKIDRSEVPEDVLMSVEFGSACPASAHVMRAWL